MEMVMAWHVVVFIDENRVEIVPKTWVINKDLCYWPNVKKHSIASLIKSCSLPDKENWEIFKIRMIGANKVYDDYTLASNAASKACYKSDISSSESELAKKTLTKNSKGRVIKENRRYLSHLSEDEEDSSDTSSLKSLPANSLTNNSKATTSLSQNVSDDSEVECIKPNNHNNLNNRRKNSIVANDNILRSSPPVRQTKCQGVNDEGVANDVSVIKEHLEAANQPINTADVTAADNNYQFPFNNIESLEEFDETLVEKENFSKIVKFMSRIGGASPYDFVKRVMGRIITDELASQFSFTGHKGKKKMGEYIIIKAMQEASKNDKKFISTEVEIEQKIKDWLRHAPARAKKEKNQNRDIE